MTSRVIDLIPNLSPQSQQTVAVLVRQLCENEGIHVPLGPAPGLQTLEEGIPLWEASLINQTYSPGTIRIYTYYVRRFLTDDPRPTSLSISKTLADELVSGTSPTAVKNELKAIRSFFGYLYDEALWPENPTRTLKPPKIAKRKVQCPSFEDVTRLLKVVDKPKMAVLLSLAIGSGLRFREASLIHWGQIDFDKRQATVIGKGNKQRVIPFSELTSAMLLTIKPTDAHPDDLVFPSRSLEGWDNRDANRSLERLCKKAGIRKYTCHQFRHFFATYTLEHGGDLAAISEILGHAKISTTVDEYVHTSEQRMKITHDEHSPLAQLQKLMLPELPEGKAEEEGGIEQAEAPADLSGPVQAKKEAPASPSIESLTMTTAIQVQVPPGQN